MKKQEIPMASLTDRQLLEKQTSHAERTDKNVKFISDIMGFCVIAAIVIIIIFSLS